jgi:LacI family transcriptional regulator
MSDQEKKIKPNRLPKRASNELPPAGNAITIADIAREAGVHPGSVSRALRGIDGKVSAQTRQRIEHIARELGYQPNAVAASLRTKQSKLVGVIVPDLGNPLFGPLVTGIEVELRRQGFMCLVVHTTDDPSERSALVAALAHRQVSGLLILAAEVDDPLLDAVLRHRLPTVLVNRGFGDRRFASVVNDDHESVRLVLDHLAGLGHRCVAHIAGPAGSSTGRERRQAFSALCRSRKLTPQIVQASAFTREAGYAAASKLLAKSFTSTAVFAANDLIAMGVLDALRARQLSVPRDVSVVGHNDMPLVDLIDPPLTTVRVAVEQMSQQAAQLLLDLLKTPEQSAVTRLLLPRLVVRGSTALAPSSAASVSHSRSR